MGDMPASHLFARTRPFHRSTYKRPARHPSNDATIASYQQRGRWKPELLAARGIVPCRSHATFTVMLARLLVLRPSPRFSRKRGRSQCTHHHKALLISNPTEKVHASWHGIQGPHRGHTGMYFNTENSFLSSFFSYADLFSAYNSAQ